MTIDVAVVDAHHHLAKMELGYPWLAPNAPTDRYHGDDRALRRDYLIDHYRADTEGLPLAASVHIENGAADPRAEARWLGEIIDAHGPVPAVHVAGVDLGTADAAAALDEFAEMPHVRGVRHILNWHPNPRFSHTPRNDIMFEPLWRQNFARLAQRGLSFDLQVFPDQIQDATRLAAEYPETNIILDHLGMPLARDADYLQSWRSGLRTLANHHNVTVKISAIGTTDHRWSTASIRPLVLATIDEFAPNRVMFGSNFPVDGMYSTLAELYQSFDTITAGFSREERGAMFGQTAARVYRIKLHSP